MNETEYFDNITGGNTLRETATVPDVYFWEGYCRGLRRHHHGENFGTTEEHERRMLPCAERKRQKFLHHLGYKAGFDGEGIAEAIALCGEAVKQVRN